MRYGYVCTYRRDRRGDHVQRRALAQAGVPKANVFVDRLSGPRKTAPRPGWSALEVRLRGGDELVVWRIDRIGRNSLRAVAAVDELLERGVRLRFLEDGIDPSTREGRIQLAVMGRLAMYDRGLVSEGVKAGMEGARAQGVRLGRPAPDPEVIARRVREVERLVETEHLTVKKAVSRVGWSRSTYYRHRRQVDRDAGE